MADDPVRIAQFWQAVEIFGAHSLPKIDLKNHTVGRRGAESGRC